MCFMIWKTKTKKGKSNILHVISSKYSCVHNAAKANMKSYFWVPMKYYNFKRWFLNFTIQSLKGVSWISNYVQSGPPKVSNLAPLAAFPASTGQIWQFWGAKLYMVMRLHRGCGPIVGSLHFHSLPVPCILQCHNGLKSIIKKHSYIFAPTLFFSIFLMIWIWIPTYFWKISETSRKDLSLEN